MGTKFPIFSFQVCKIYLGKWAHKARRAHGHVGHVERVGHIGHVDTLGTPFRRLTYFMHVMNSVLLMS